MKKKRPMPMPSKRRRAGLSPAQLDELRPETITCNECGARLSDVEHLTLAPYPGLAAVFTANCEPCAAVTYVPVGSDEAVRAFLTFLSSEATSVPRPGFQPS